MFFTSKSCRRLAGRMNLLFRSLRANFMLAMWTSRRVIPSAKRVARRRSPGLGRRFGMTLHYRLATSRLKRKHWDRGTGVIDKAEPTGGAARSARHGGRHIWMECLIQVRRWHRFRQIRQKERRKAICSPPVNRMLVPFRPRSCRARISSPSSFASLRTPEPRPSAPSQRRCGNALPCSAGHRRRGLRHSDKPIRAG